MHWQSIGAGSYMLQEKKIRQFHPGGLAILFLWFACIFDPVGMLFNIKFVAIIIVYIVIFFKLIKKGGRLDLTKDYIWFFIFFCNSAASFRGDSFSLSRSFRERRRYFLYIICSVCRLFITLSISGISRCCMPEPIDIAPSLSAFYLAYIAGDYHRAS